MLYLLYGPDGYRISIAVEKEIFPDAARHRTTAAFFSFDCQQDGRVAEWLSDTLKGVSLFDERKSLIIRNVSALSAEAEREVISVLKKYKTAEDKNVAVVFTDVRPAEKAKASGLPKTKALLRYVGDEKGIVRELPFLRGAQLVRWVKNEFNAQKKEVDSGAVDELIRRSGPDTGLLAQEVEKLSNYGGHKITTADVLELTSSRIEFGVFNLTDALSQKNGRLAVELLYRMLAQENEPYRILTAITYQFRVLLMAKDLLERGKTRADIVRKLGVHPFVAEKAVGQSARFALQELKDIFSELLRLDTGAKRGELNLTDELYRFIVRDVPVHLPKKSA